ncbi:MAG: DNA primase [Alloprevotella sp.]|nr:MAG: DNA primase [Alloprevotella sp.]
MIDRSTIDRIMAAADIVDVVGEFVTLRRSGANYKGLCPFHDEKTPSFMVSPSKQLCKCFSCGNGGNVVKFVMQHEQMTYPEALKWLGRRYGIEVKEREQTAEQKAAATAREAMFVVNEWARDYFVETLHNNVDGLAIGMSYFRRRGLRDDIIRKFQLGYSLEQRDALAQKAHAKGFEEKYIESTGLCYRTEDGRLLDRYHGRVIFPVHSVSGRIVAFGGRILNQEQKNVGKYVNSPESEIYSKKRELYGLYLAKQAIVKQDRCYLVEGYLDVISMHQSGVENVVASSGTALTPEQVRLIHRFTNNVTVLYDGDAAGIHASLRGIDILLSEGLNIKVMLLPEGEDPDSYAQARTPEEFRKDLEENEEDFIQFKANLLLKDAGRDPMKRASVITDLTRSISVIPSDIVRQVYIHDLAGRLNIDESAIVNEVAKEIRKRKEEAHSRSKTTPPSSTQSSTQSKIQPAAAQQHSGEHDIPLEAYEQLIPPPESVSGAHDAQQALTSLSTNPLNQEGTISGSTINLGESKAQQQLIACELQLIQLVIRYGQLPTIAQQTEVETPWSAAKKTQTTEIIADSPLVAPYILEELSNDDIHLQVDKHQQILEEAAQHTLENPETFNSRDYFITHPDQEINRLAAELADDRYPLSIEQQKAYVPEEKRLVDIVPRVINDYKHAILGVQKEEVLLALRQPELQQQPDKMNELLRQLIEINELEKQFAKVLGDRVLVR